MRRHKCNKDDPWTREKNRYATHPDAVEIEDQKDNYPRGDKVTYKCPNCNKVFQDELPQ